MRGPALRPVVIAAGGTGGHFFPAEALASALIARGCRVALMTDARSGALKSDVFAGGEVFVLSGAGIAGRGAVRAGKAGLALAAGAAQARSMLVRLRPGVVVGFGGYPSVAPVLAARMLRDRPAVILHEQNAVLGRANRLLCRWSTRLALSFGETERVPARMATILAGNPVRPSIVALADAPYSAPTTEIRLLVVGGSLGARVFSDVVPAALAALPSDLRARLRVTQQCRTEDLERVRAAYAASDVTAELSSFFPNVAERLGAAHLVIGRAGASTVAELAAVGRPAVLVPLPGAIDDHQSANARALSAVGGAWVMAQPGFTPGALGARLSELFARQEMLARSADASRSVARPNAAETLADLALSLMPQEVR